MRELMIIINTMAMILGAWFWAGEVVSDFWELSVATSVVVIPLANILFILNYSDRDSQGLLSLFLKRKRLEEQSKISNLTNDDK